MASIINALTASGGGVAISGDATGNLALQSAGNTAVTINTSQNVGIGTTSPTAQLQVFAQDSASGKAVRVAYDGTYYTDITESGYHCYNNQLTIDTKNNFPIVFGTNNTERMRITSGGLLLVGQTSQTGAEKLGVSFDRTSQWGMTIKNTSATSPSGATYISFNYAGTETGYINSTGTNTTYSTSSDYRLKENITPMTGALAKVALLKPCTYTWKANGSTGQGFIAHELQEVVPDAVTGEKDAVNEDGSIKSQGIDTSYLVATLTAAIQELNAKVEAQAAEIAALKGAK